MNIPELRNITRRFSKISPAFLEWCTRAAQTAAKANGTSQDTEWQEQLESWQRTLQGVSEGEGLEVLGRMEKGAVTVPPYGDLAQLIRREAMIARQQETRSLERGSYKCLACLYSGIAEVWNPHFIESYRPRFDDVTREETERNGQFKPANAWNVNGKHSAFDLSRFDPDGLIVVYRYDPPTWLADAAAWWRSLKDDQNPIHHVALCNCDCPKQRILAEQLEEFNQGTRRSVSGKKATLPACGAATYDPRTMPLKTALPYDDLARWYATHKVNETYEWQPEGSAK